MKVTAANADRFVAEPGADVVAILAYGPDSGLVRERCLKAIRSVVDDPSDPFRVCEIAPGQLRDDPARLSDEVFALSMMGGRRVVFLRGSTDGDAGPVSDVLGQGGFDALLVVEGGDLPPRSTLRKLFETAPDAAAVPCYADDAGTIRELAQEMMAAHGIRVDNDAIAYLSASLGGDRMVSRQELEKLALYAGDGGAVTLADAVACVGDSAAVTLDDIAFAVGRGDSATALRALERAKQEGQEEIGVLRAVQRHFQRLHLCSGRVAAGMTAEQAVQGLRPPIFFKNTRDFRIQMSFWPEKAAESALQTLNEAEIACKSTGYPVAAICERALLSLSAWAGAARRRSA